MMWTLLSIGEKLTEIIESALKINFAEFIINIAATIILVLIVRFFFWNKVTSFLDKKRESVIKEYKTTSDLKDEAESIKAEAITTLEASKKQASSIVMNAQTQATSESTRIISSAKSEAEGIIKSSKEEALKEKNQVVKDAQKEIVDIASKLAARMIDENIDTDKYNESILKEIGDDDE